MGDIYTKTIVFLKWSDKVEGSGYRIFSPLCRGIYNEEDRSIVTWSVIYPYENINCFNCYIEDNEWIVSGHQYNNKFKN